MIAEYKSSSGQVVPFAYEDIESSIYLKGSPFETIIGNGTFVQRLGKTSGIFPMNCIFHGDDYQAKADAFLSAIGEDGEGRLTHPIYGPNIRVRVIGTVTVTNPLKTADGQVIVSCAFYETVALQVGETADAYSVFDSLVEASAVDFSQKVDLSDPLDKVSLKNRIESTLAGVQAKLKKAAGGVAHVTQAIEDAGDSLARGMDILIGEPLTLGFQCQQLISEPRRQNERLRYKMSAYNNLAEDLFAFTIGEPSKYSKEAENTFHFHRLMAQSIVANAAMLAMESWDYFTKGDYIQTALGLTDLHEAYLAWHDAGYDTIAIDDVFTQNIDTGDGVGELSAVLAAAIADLMRRAADGKTEIREATTRPEALIPACMDRYGTSKEPTLTLFIESNGLAGDEIIEIPKGRELVWYV